MLPFELRKVEAIEDALELLETNPDSTKILAGGTALINLIKQGFFEPTVLVDLSGLSSLKRIEAVGDELLIGSMATLTAVAKSPLIELKAPFLRSVLLQTANRRLRNMSTLGGCLSHAEAASDPPAALLVLGARLHVTSRSGARTIPLSDFFTGFYETSMGAGEILTGITIEKQPHGARHSYYKFTPRSKYDKPTLGIAIRIVRDEKSKLCTSARLALSSAGPIVTRMYPVEEMLEGQLITTDLAEAAGKVTAEVAEPYADTRGSEDYKRHMIRTLVPRVIMSV